MTVRRGQALPPCAAMPQHWEVPDFGADATAIAVARRATATCHTCPLLNQGCGSVMSDRDRAGWIVNGVPYHSWTAEPLPRCRRCGWWCYGRKADVGYCGEKCFNQARGARRRARETGRAVPVLVTATPIGVAA